MVLSGSRKVSKIYPIESAKNDLKDRHESNKAVRSVFEKVLKEEIMKIEEKSSEKE